MREGRPGHPVQLAAATRLDDESAHAWAVFSEALDRAGDAAGAREAIGRAAALQPGDADLVRRARR